MKRVLEKPERIAICRRCYGTGRLGCEPLQANRNNHDATCPQCGGSGRVMVSCRMELEIHPFPDKHKEVKID